MSAQGQGHQGQASGQGHQGQASGQGHQGQASGQGHQGQDHGKGKPHDPTPQYDCFWVAHGCKTKVRAIGAACDSCRVRLPTPIPSLTARKREELTMHQSRPRQPTKFCTLSFEVVTTVVTTFTTHILEWTCHRFGRRSTWMTGARD
jgi:hypothetical protein